MKILFKSVIKNQNPAKFMFKDIEKLGQQELVGVRVNNMVEDNKRGVLEKIFILINKGLRVILNTEKKENLEAVKLVNEKMSEYAKAEKWDDFFLLLAEKHNLPLFILTRENSEKVNKGYESVLGDASKLLRYQGIYDLYFLTVVKRMSS